MAESKHRLLGECIECQGTFSLKKGGLPPHRDPESGRPCPGSHDVPLEFMIVRRHPTVHFAQA